MSSPPTTNAERWVDPLKDLEDLLARLGVEPPGWLVTVVVVLLLAAVAGVVLTPLVSVARYGWTLAQWLLGRRYGVERRRQRRRGKLATHLDNQLVGLELQEDWRDEKYAELEAEVEIERTWRWRWLRVLLPFHRPTLRRVRSLSTALAGGAEPLLLLEGEPGAGKSIALRHLARKLARRAARGGNPRRVIPLYLNLKALDVPPEEVSADRIRRFVLDTLTEVNNRDVEEVLDEEFDRGLDDGTWLFLFDSFDEIPDILSAPDARTVIPTYARAIADFLAFTNCRGVVASRDFSSPDTVRFTRCRILRLSRKQQLTLIRRADLEPRVDRAMREGLGRASQDIATFAGNPMFLGLLCEHMRTTAEFPTSSHAVFEEYLAHRLRRDAERIRSRFGAEVDFVRSGAEEIAYIMTSTPRMGLDPTRSAVLDAVQALDRLAPAAVERILDVLEYTKLGRARTNTHGETTFSFIHRRFQEYFATCLAIQDRTRVGAVELLDHDQWRETAVTLLQVQDGEATAPLLAEATDRLRTYVADLDTERFRWPEGCRHLLGILSTGLESRPESVSAEVRGLVGKILEPAWDRGHRLDRRRALQYATLADPPVTERILIEALAADNKYLRQSAFGVAGRLTELSPPLRTQIRRTLLTLTAHLQPAVRPSTVRTEVRRLRRPAEFLALVGFLQVATPLAIALPALAWAAAVVAVLPEFTAAVVTATAKSGAEAGTEAVAAVASVWAIVVLTVVVGANVLVLLDGAARLRPAPQSGRQPVRAWALFWIPAALNVVLCVGALYAVGSAWTGPPAVGIALQVLCCYAMLLPPAAVWATLTDRHARAALLPALPVMFLGAVLLGRMRLPALPETGRRTTTPAHVDRRELVEMSGFLVLVAPPSVLVTAGLALAGSHRVLTVLITATVAGLVGTVFVLSASSRRSRRRAADHASTADDVLDLFAHASSDLEFTTLVHRFTAIRITRDPAVREAVENLVGELEQAQRGRPGERVRLACPSLANRPVERHRLLDTYPFRWISSYYVREIQESTLDDLARLADQD